MPSMASNPSSNLQPEQETLDEEEGMSPPDVESSGSNPSSNPQHEREALVEEHERGPNAIEADADDSMSMNDDDDIYVSDDLLGSDDDDTDYGDDDDDGDDDDSDDNSEEEEEEEEEEEGNGIESCNQSCGADCPICLLSWNSDGPHRICCIPCGHIYGRSCLEQWLQRHQRKSAKCPQCREKFKHKNIINLHAQLTTATNESNNASASGEKVEVQGKQEEWPMTKENWDMLCSRVDSLYNRNENSHSKLNGLGLILEMLQILESEIKNIQI